MSPTFTPPVRPGRKHPPINDVTDALTFRLAKLVGINERAGQLWSEQVFDISLNDWRVIGVTYAKGPLRASVLADELLMDKSQLSRLIKSLSARGFLEVSKSVSDARAVDLRLTESGVDLHDRFLAAVTEGNERIVDVVSTEELGVFMTVLDRLTHHTQEMLHKREGKAPAR